MQKSKLTMEQVEHIAGGAGTNIPVDPSSLDDGHAYIFTHPTEAPKGTVYDKDVFMKMIDEKFGGDVSGWKVDDEFKLTKEQHAFALRFAKAFVG